MDDLHIEIEARPWKLGSTGGRTLLYGGGAATLIHINGEPLIDIVGRCELPCASADGQADLAGTCRPLWGYRFDHGLFFGRPSDPELRHPGGIVLMGCDCGVVGCWPLVCRLRIRDQRIVWDSFRQPFRPKWDHGELGPFIFHRVAYEDEVTRAHERFVQLVASSVDQQRNYEERTRVLRSDHPDHDWPDWATVAGNVSVNGPGAVP